MPKKPIEFNLFTGIDNTVPRHRLPEGFVADAVNLDATSAGTLKVRPGKEVLAVVTGGNSLRDCAGKMFLTITNALHVVTNLSPFTSTTLRSGMSSLARVSYADVNGEVWWSNGTDSGRCTAANADKPWSLPKPTAPTLATTTGALPANKYRVSIVHRNADGEESPASNPAQVTLSATGGLTVNLSAAPTGATHTLVFCTSGSGVFLLHSTVSAATSTVTISADPVGRPLGEAYKLDVMPAGRIVAHFNGRLLSASGSTLYVSEPYRHGVYDPVAGRIPFATDITVVAPLKDGVFVVADKVYWLAGADVAEMIPVPKSLGTAIFGTQFELREDKQVGWFGEFGLTIGSNDGTVAHLTQTNFAPPTADSGYALVKRDDGDIRILISMDETAAYTPRAAKEFIDHIADYHADTNMLSILINAEKPAVTRYASYPTKGMAELDGLFYALSNDKLCLMDGTLDDTSQIDWVVALGKLGAWSQQLKMTPAIYISAKCSAAIRCDIAAEKGEYSYMSRTYSPDRTEIIRVDTGKGLRETWYDVRLVGEDVDAELSGVSLLITDTARII